MKNAWRSWGAGAALIIVLTIAAYFPALRCGFIWDDDHYVTENPTLRTQDGLRKIWFKPGATPQYYPLTFTSFWAEYHLWSLQPSGYHLLNVLLHAVNAVLLWRVLRKLEIPGSWWAAAIFALHPVTVESVAWITERKNVLSGFFCLLALLAYFRFRPLTGPEANRTPEWRFYLLALALFLCALWSKTVAFSFPAVLVLVIWRKAGRLEKRDAVALSPLFVLGAGLAFMTTWVEKHVAGASGAEWALSIVQRCLVAGRALWFYAGKLFWPRQLTFIYPRWEIDAGAAWQYLFPLAALATVIALWLLRARIGKGPLVAVLYFAGTLFPALGFVNVYPFRYSYVADHFQYLACIGLIAMAVSAATVVFQRAGPRGRDLGPVAAVAVLLLLGASTWKQAHIYRNLETLWRDTLAKNPNAWMAHNNLASVLAGQGRVQEAITEYMASLRLNPNHVEAHVGLGAALGSQGRIDEAIAEFRTALRLKPDFAPGYYNLGFALALQGKVAEAVAEYREALRLQPNSVTALSRLAWILATDQNASIRNAGEAVTLAQRLCAITGSRRADALDVLAAAYAAADRFSEAVAAAQRASALARAAGQPQLAQEIEMRLELYRTGHAYRR